MDTEVSPSQELELMRQKLVQSQNQEKGLMRQVFYKNRSTNKKKEQIELILQDICRLKDLLEGKEERAVEDGVYALPWNNELRQLMAIQREKCKQIEELNEKIFSKKLQKYEHFEKKNDQSQQESVYNRANQIKQQNEQLGILISKEHLDSYYLEGQQYKQVGEGLKDEISQVTKDIHAIRNDIQAETETLSQYNKKLAQSRHKNASLKADIKQFQQKK